MLRRIYSIYSLISYWYKTIKIPEHFALCLITVMCDILYVDMHVPTFVHAFMTESNYNAYLTSYTRPTEGLYYTNSIYGQPCKSRKINGKISDRYFCILPVLPILRALLDISTTQHYYICYTALLMDLVDEYNTVLLLQHDIMLI